MARSNGCCRWGKRPIKRPLPSQRFVRIIRHLRSAVQKLTSARLSDEDRAHLTRLLDQALDEAEERIRNRFRPVLTAVLEDVGIRARNAPERVAFQKMIEEFLDRILAVGFVTFGDLRDTISRNQLKLPDLSDPQDFIRGDALLRLDRRLSTLLDGVYRQSEIYVRWLERLTALNFGTKIGRAITRFVTVPFGGAFLLIEGGKLILDEGYHLAGSEKHTSDISPTMYYSVLGGVGVFMLLLLHSTLFRRSLCQYWQIDRPCVTKFGYRFSGMADYLSDVAPIDGLLAGAIDLLVRTQTRSVVRADVAVVTRHCINSGACGRLVYRFHFDSQFAHWLGIYRNSLPTMS